MGEEQENGDGGVVPDCHVIDDCVPFAPPLLP